MGPVRRAGQGDRGRRQMLSRNKGLEGTVRGKTVTCEGCVWMGEERGLPEDYSENLSDDQTS